MCIFKDIQSIVGDDVLGIPSSGYAEHLALSETGEGGEAQPRRVWRYLLFTCY